MLVTLLVSSRSRRRCSTKCARFPMGFGFNHLPQPQ
jgi:hypothetical protein